MKNITILVFALVWGIGGISAQEESKDDQNLVPNGSFEDWEGKLKKPGQIALAAPWASPIEEAADLFSENTTYEPVNVPKNTFGHQGAYDGSAYAGIRAFSYQNKEPRTYLTVKLSSEMKKGQAYCITYYVSLSDLSKYGANQLTTYISKLPVKSSKEGNLKYKAQVPSLPGKIQTNLDAWVGVCDTYVAKGLERYITIGNFKENGGTDIEKVKRPADETRPQTFDAYYFIDKVSVVPVGTSGRCNCDAIDETKSDIIFGTRITANKALAPDVQLERSNVYFKRYQTPIDNSMDKFVGELVTIMKDNPSMKIELVGHIDATEEEKKKVRPDLKGLDLRRAEALKKVFTDAGVDGSRITVKGEGSEKPVSTTGSEVGEAKNRRVEVNLR